MIFRIVQELVYLVHDLALIGVKRRQVGWTKNDQLWVERRCADASEFDRESQISDERLSFTATRPSVRWLEADIAQIFAEVVKCVFTVDDEREPRDIDRGERTVNIRNGVNQSDRQAGLQPVHAERREKALFVGLVLAY